VFDRVNSTISVHEVYKGFHLLDLSNFENQNPAWLKDNTLFLFTTKIFAYAHLSSSFFDQNFSAKKNFSLRNIIRFTMRNSLRRRILLDEIKTFAMYLDSRFRNYFRYLGNEAFLGDGINLFQENTKIILMSQKLFTLFYQPEIYFTECVHFVSAFLDCPANFLVKYQCCLRYQCYHRYQCYPLFV
jgi:hypothetical protein